jgi:hypothetical protein
MPRVTVLLGDDLPTLLRPRRRPPLAVDAPPGASLLAIVEDLGVPHTEIGELRVDGRAARPHERPVDGALVAVEPVRRSRVAGEPRFVLDGHLGRLARLLRLLGFDAAWRPDAPDAELAARASAEGRILLSRDRGLLRRRAVRCGCLVRSQAPREQLAQVVRRYGLAGTIAPFRRCPACNALLEVPVPAAGMPPRGRCPGCGRAYWRGSHWPALRRLAEEAGGWEK